VILFCILTGSLYSSDFQFQDKPVARVEFTGHTFFSERDLNRMISLKSDGLFRKRRLFNRRVLNRDLEEIQRNYIAEGFLRCRVSDSLALTDKNQVNITLEIHEGPRFYVNSFDVRGNTLISDAEIMSMMNIKPGNPFKPFEYQRGFGLIQDEYAAMGRPYVTIEEQIREDVQMDISLIIDEDTVYSVDKIEITGNTSVQEKTIRKEILVEPGDIFDLEDIHKSRLHIFELGTFNSVNIIPVNRNPDSLTVGLRIRVSEALPRRWDANIGVRQGRIAELNQTYLYTQVDWLHKNLFHRARRFQAKGNFGVVLDQETFFRKSIPSYGVDLSYTRPRILSMRFPTTFKVYYNKDVYSPFTQNIVENDELITAGVEVSSLWKLERKLNTIASFSLRSVESILSEEKSEIQRRLNWQIRFDNRDNFLFPRKGWNIGGDFQWVKGISGSPTNYTQWDISVSRYLPVFEGLVLAARVETGFIDNQADRPPLIVMYRMGTETTVRGWSQSIGREFKTPDGLIIYTDYAKALANVELRINLPWNFGLEFFADAGHLHETYRGVWNWDQFYVSVGPGITYSTFIGPVRLEFPFVLADPKGRFQRWDQPEKHFIIALLFAF
jgi:outer membrane protein insertion porin family